jgi:transcriptional regulator of acetoin/glycerol metabolism
MPRPLDRLAELGDALAARVRLANGDARIRGRLAALALRRVTDAVVNDHRVELVVGDLLDALETLAQFPAPPRARGRTMRYTTAAIEAALAAAGGRIREAARASGIPRSTLSRRAAECPAQNWQLARDTSGKPLQR